MLCRRKEGYIIGKKLVFISHANIGLNGSEVWKRIVRGARTVAWRHEPEHVRLSVLHPDSYHDHPEFLKLVDIGVSQRPDVLILPFTLAGPEKTRFLDILAEFDGKIVAVNVPPDECACSLLQNKLIGYVGMDEVEAGRRAVMELLNHANNCETILVLTDKVDHYGYSLRIQGIKEYAKYFGVRVVEVPFQRNEPLVLPGDLPDKFGIITVGIRGTEKALAIDREKILGIVGMDLNPETAAAIRDGRMICTLIQHPDEEGASSVLLALKPGEEFTKILCGPTVVNKSNIAIMSEN